MEDTGAHGRVQGKLGVWHPWHSSVHPTPLLTHGKCRGKWGAKHLKGIRGQPGEAGTQSPVPVRFQTQGPVQTHGPGDGIYIDTQNRGLG